MTAKSTNIERLRTQNRKAYSSWAAHNCPAFSAFSDEVVLLKYLSDIGLRIKSIYDETDAAKRIIPRVSRIMKRIDSFLCFFIFANDNLKILFIIYHPISFKKFCKDSLLPLKSSVS